MSSENTASFHDIFKSENEIPEEFKVPEIHQKVYLLNGELVEWKGETQNIYSPVCIPTQNGLRENYWEAFRILARKKRWKFWKHV